VPGTARITSHPAEPKILYGRTNTSCMQARHGRHPPRDCVLCETSHSLVHAHWLGRVAPNRTFVRSAMIVSRKESCCGCPSRCWVLLFSCLGRPMRSRPRHAAGAVLLWTAADDFAQLQGPVALPALRTEALDKRRQPQRMLHTANSIGCRVRESSERTESGTHWHAAATTDRVSCARAAGHDGHWMQLLVLEPLATTVRRHLRKMSRRSM